MWEKFTRLFYIQLKEYLILLIANRNVQYFLSMFLNVILVKIWTKPIVPLHSLCPGALHTLHMMATSLPLATHYQSLLPGSARLLKLGIFQGAGI